jgi:hypothetical protein
MPHRLAPADHPRKPLSEDAGTFANMKLQDFFNSGETRISSGMLSGTRERVIGAAVLWVFAIANQFMVTMPRQSVEGGTDFLSFYAGGRFAADQRLYDHAAIQKFQLELGWHSDTLAFIRPPFYAGSLWPLSKLSLSVASRIWIAIGVTAVIVSVWAAYPLLGPLWVVLPAILASYPLSLAFISGQDVPILLALVAVAMRLIDRKLMFIAGLVLSLCAIKFHLFFSLPIFLFRRREWTLAKGVAAGGILLVTVSFLLQGWDWPVRYWNQLTNTAIEPAVSVMPNLRGLFFGVPGGVLLEIVGAAVVAAFSWRGSGPNVSSEMAFSVMLLAGLLVSHHSYTQDAGLILPACLIFYRKSASLEGRWLALLCMCPVVWVLMQVPGLRAVPVIIALLLLICVSYWDLSDFEVRRV